VQPKHPLTWYAWYLATSLPDSLPAQSASVAAHARLPSGAAQQMGLVLGHTIFLSFAVWQSAQTVLGPSVGVCRGLGKVQGRR
jgi:hypothetical protein